MRILFCTNTFDRGENGPTKFANLLLNIPTVIPDVEIKILTEDISEENLIKYSDRVHKVTLRLKKWQKAWGFIFRMFPYYVACKRLRSTYQYDVVVFNNAIIGIWSSLYLSVPVVGMINDYTSISMTLLRKHYPIRQRIRRLVFRIFERLACKVQKGVLVNSLYLREEVVRAYGISSSRVKVVYKGVAVNEASIIRRARNNIESGEPVRVLFIKTDYLIGGLHDLIEALGKCNTRYFVLDVVGPNKAECFNFQNSNKPSNVSLMFHGLLSEELIGQFFMKADLFIVPSHMEALGVANMEALLHGVPVITTNVGGIPEVLNKGKNGWMVAPQNPTLLADTIEYVLDHPEERWEKQQNGHIYVKENFNHLRSLKQFVQALRDLV